MGWLAWKRVSFILYAIACLHKCATLTPKTKYLCECVMKQIPNEECHLSKDDTADEGLNLDSLKMVKLSLSRPPLQSVVDAFKENLKSKYDDVEVEIVENPNLQSFRFGLKGLSGDSAIIRVGAPRFLLVDQDCQKIYNLKDLPQITGIKNGRILGTSSGPYLNSEVQGLSEYLFNIKVKNGKLVNNSTALRLDRHDYDVHYIEQTQPDETRLAFFGDLIITEENPGQVIHIHVKRRKGNNDFLNSIYNALNISFPDKCVGLIGVLKINGRSKLHIQPPYFSKPPAISPKREQEWLEFFQSIPNETYISNGMLLSCNTGIPHNKFHFHAVTNCNTDGGHYWNDTDPDGSDIEGYFKIAKNFYSIDGAN